mgnify:FL=1
MKMRMIAKLNLMWLLSESRNFRNDGWVQQGYREIYKEALLEYIKTYPTLRELGSQ